MRTLHLRCGSDIRDSLGAAGLLEDADFLEWADPVCQGPVLDLPEAEYFARRRAWISAAWEIPLAELEAKLISTTSLIARLHDYAEVCLWFEHDLYDQSMLIQVLAALAEHPELHDRLRIVSIDRHPQLRRFIGFGQLRPEHFPALHEGRQRLTPAAFELAQAAWSALRQPDPTRLREGDWRSEALPFLAGALARHLDEFPGEVDGLGLTQRLSLEIITALEASQGAAFAAQVFGALLQGREPMPWLGDTMYWSYLRELADPAAPLITMLGDFPGEQLSLTDMGRAVLAGTSNWLDLAGPPALGPSRWRGGVEIIGARG
ncbi:DUF1835 domain-containing protein [Pseudenhygromyxa sp. WMMC2535]|uniref:DUF1835 domain-containing protein n=1 Tax=Pseudenhygromyxa sp. WMMC2535 TaxID=2712867 RepID=UPI00155719B5|nr:DUF1835 domain-containing protein [Pseudenhygromyxa sp. WMMC2535]